MRIEITSLKKVGRPRDERARQCVLEAVRELLRSRGLCGVSMEGIARKAGVGKQTLYRWWPSMAEVILEASLEGPGETVPVPDTGDPAEDLRRFLSDTFRTINLHSGSLLKCLIVEAQKNEAFAQRFRDGFISKRRESLAGILRKRWKEGGPDPDLLAEMIFGTIWYRLLVGHSPLSEDLASSLAAYATALPVPK